MSSRHPGGARVSPGSSKDNVNSQRSQHDCNHGDDDGWAVLPEPTAGQAVPDGSHGRGREGGNPALLVTGRVQCHLPHGGRGHVVSMQVTQHFLTDGCVLLWMRGGPVEPLPPSFLGGSFQQVLLSFIMSTRITPLTIQCHTSALSSHLYLNKGKTQAFR